MLWSQANTKELDDTAPGVRYVSSPSETREPLRAEYAQTIQDDECYINPKPTTITWKEMAFRAEKVMIRLHEELLREGYPPHPPEGGCGETSR